MAAAGYRPGFAVQNLRHFRCWDGGGPRIHSHGTHLSSHANIGSCDVSGSKTHRRHRSIKD
eukprot:5523669-Pyramimonas_sp.AAC.1